MKSILSLCAIFILKSTTNFRVEKQRDGAKIRLTQKYINSLAPLAMVGTTVYHNYFFFFWLQINKYVNLIMK